MKVGIRSFWFGFALAVGALLTVAVIAYARQTPESVSASRTGAHSNPSERLAPGDGAAGFDLKALSGPRTLADDLQGVALETASHLRDGVPSEAVDPGSLLLSESRLLLSDLGTRSGKFYVVPTSKGQLCYIITGYLDAGCLAPGPVAARGIDWGLSDNDALGGGDPLVVHGLVANDVAEVDVVVAGQSERAILANNAFYREVDESAFPDALVVTFTDGHQARIVIPSPPEPAASVKQAAPIRRRGSHLAASLV
jgi:hypothetical protein